MEAREATAPAAPSHLGTGASARTPLTIATAAGLLIPLGFATWRVVTLGPTSWRTLTTPVTAHQLGHFKLSIVGEMCTMLAVVLLIVVAGERRRLSSIGLKAPSLSDLGWAPVVAVATVPVVLLWCGAILVIGSYPFDGSLAHGQSAATFALPLSVRLFMLVGEPMFEEVVYRGFLMERIIDLSGSLALAVMVSTFASSLMHGGWMLGLAILPIFASYAIFYAWRRNTWANALLHLVWMLDLIIEPMLKAR